MFSFEMPAVKIIMRLHQREINTVRLLPWASNFGRAFVPPDRRPARGPPDLPPMSYHRTSNPVLFRATGGPTAHLSSRTLPRTLSLGARRVRPMMRRWRCNAQFTISTQPRRAPERPSCPAAKVAPSDNAAAEPQRRSRIPASNIHRAAAP